MQPVEHPIDPDELNAYVDGEGAEPAPEIEAHLKTCAACQKVVKDLRGVSRDLGAWSIDGAPGSLRAGDLFDKARIRQPWRLRWMPSWVTIPAIGVAAVALLVVATVPKRAPSVSALVVPPPPGQARGTVATVEAEPVVTAPRPPVRVGGQAILGGYIQGQGGPPAARAPRIIRTASLRSVAKDFDTARASVERIASGAGGYVGTLNVSGARPSSRTLTAIVHVPADRLAGTVAALRALGEVVEESQGAADVSEQLVDLEARLANSRNTEQRMNELLRTRTGRLSDVLEAEREVARVREEIERLDAQRKNLETRVTYSAINVQIDEEHKSSISLGPLPLSVRLRNALVDGFRTAFEAAVTTALLFLQLAPVVLFWLIVVGVPVRMWMRRRARAAA
jgi:hypothetical protein